MKALTAYFSATGVTKKLAERIANLADSDIFEIEPEIPYTKEDLNWTNSESRSSVEMNDFNSRPEIANTCPNMDEYDKIFLGFPIWWYVAPTIIRTFLEAYDFSGKTVIPFCTSGTSQPGGTDAYLKEVCPDANFKPTVRFKTNVKDEALKDWIEG